MTDDVPAMNARQRDSPRLILYTEDKRRFVQLTRDMTKAVRWWTRAEFRQEYQNRPEQCRDCMSGRMAMMFNLEAFHWY